MHPVYISLFQSAAVVALAVVGWMGAVWLSRRKWWFVGMVPAFAWLALVLINRWVPIESAMLAGRTEFVLGALAIPLLLVVPTAFLSSSGQRIRLRVFSMLLTAWYSLVPFVAPALEHTYQSRLVTFIDEDGICLQSNGWNCGPAAAVTVLRGAGIKAEEGAVAIAAHTSQLTGTPEDQLIEAVAILHGIEGRFLRIERVDELCGMEPFIAVVKYAPMLDHYVAVFEVGESFVRIGDPLMGERVMSMAAFNARWRGTVILFPALFHPRGD